jgi:hypothetical protein
MRERIGNLIRISLKLGIALGLFYLIFRSVDLAKFRETLIEVNLPVLLLPCAVYVVSLLIASLKLKYILRGYQIPIGLKTAFELNWISGFFNNFLPSTVGGDFYRILCLNRAYPQKPAQVVSAVILDRGLGLLAMLVVAGLASTFFIGALIPSAGTILAVYAAIGLATFAAFFVLFFEHNLRISYDSRSALAKKIVNGLNVLLAYADKRALILSLLSSFVLLALTMLANYFLFRAFNRDVSVLVLLFVITVVNLAGMIPISINALGVTEGLGIVLFSHFGYEPELILSIFLTARVLLLLCSATGGIPFLLKRGFPIVGPS